MNPRAIEGAVRGLITALAGTPGLKTNLIMSPSQRAEALTVVGLLLDNALPQDLDNALPQDAVERLKSLLRPPATVTPAQPLQVTLDATQLHACDLAAAGVSLFITGPAGVGKGEVVRTLVSRLRASGKVVRSVASTGIAAVANGGTTVHSMLGTGLASTKPDAVRLMGVDRNSKALLRARDLLKGTHVIVWDEVSMNTGDFVSMADRWLREVMQNKSPFGGIQMVFSGDFMQLPAVANEFTEHRYAFQSPAWKALNPTVVLLDKCYRVAGVNEDDRRFVETLMRLRLRKHTREDLDWLNRATRHTVSNPVLIRPTNAEADVINRERLEALAGTASIYEAKFGGYEDSYDKVAESAPADRRLVLKVGAAVVLTKNTPAYVNGDQGVVTALSPTAITVLLNSGRSVTVSEATWELKRADRVVASMTQYPVRLGWALTIHKSQGMSLSAISVDLTRTFEKGMAYVALSRVRSFAGLHLVSPVSNDSMKTSKQCRLFYEGIAPLRPNEGRDPQGPTPVACTHPLVSNQGTPINPSFRCLVCGHTTKREQDMKAL